MDFPSLLCVYVLSWKHTEMEAKLIKLKSGRDSVTPEESARITKEHQDTVRQWRKRKRMVSCTLYMYVKTESLSFTLTLPPPHTHTHTHTYTHTHTHTHTHTQTTDIVNAILEGYPKSKKELFVSHH